MTALILKETHLALTTTCILKHTDTSRQRADRYESPLTPNFHQGPQQSDAETHACSHARTSLIDSYSASRHFDASAATTPAMILHHPTQKSLNREQLKGVCAVSLGGIKDVESGHACAPCLHFPLG